MSELSERIRANQPCPITGEFEAEVVATRSRDGEPLRNVMSVASGLVYVDPRPIEDLAKFYREEYRLSYKKTFVPKPQHILRAGRVALGRFRRTSGLIKPGMRCLDIGAGGGEWVYLLQNRGCDAHGIEPNAGYGSFAKDQYGVEVFLGMYQDSEFEHGSFDLISLFHVLEHLSDPVEDLRRMGKFLKNGGHLLIEVPNIFSSRDRMGNKWHAGHLFGFDGLTLEAVAAKAGFKLARLKAPFGVVYAEFVKSGEESLPLPDLSGHFSFARAALLHGGTEYWKKSETYKKIFPRFVKKVKERWNSRRSGTPKEMLDGLFHQ